MHVFGNENDEAIRDEEMSALSAIYGNQFNRESTSSATITLRDNPLFQLLIRMPFDYPSLSPPTFQIGAPTLSRSSRDQITDQLQEIYLQNMGTPIVHLWVEAVKEELEMINDESNEQKDEKVAETSDSMAISVDIDEIAPKITSGQPIVDRKSTFQAHAAIVTSKKQVESVLRTLKMNNKIARATHNIFAYRIFEEIGERTIKLQDSVDDGESGAGPKLVHLLEILDARNVVVVVTRWYGGVHLGPDRFRHICNVARKVLLLLGFGTKKTEDKKRH